MISERSARKGLILILALFLLAGTVYSVLAPLGEGPDETDQFEYIRYAGENLRVPRNAQDRIDAGGKSDEPPLYYALLAGATGWLDVRDLPRLKLLDPYLYPRHTLPDEVLINYALLHTADEAWPFRGLVLQWHLARLLTVLMAAGTIVVLYAVVRRLVPRRPEVALLAATVAALNPQFIYIGAALNNDNLCALFGALLLLFYVRIAQGDRRWREYVLLGVILGLDRMTKFYTLAMLPLTVLVFVILAWRQRTLRHVWGMLLSLAVCFAVSLPWLLYIQPNNPVILRGSGQIMRLFDIGRMERWFSPQGEGTVGSGVGAIFRAAVEAARMNIGAWASTLFKSFWAYFGPMTVQAPVAVYWAVGLLCLASLAGWLRILVQKLFRRATVLAECRDLWIPGLQLLATLGMEFVFFGVMKVLPYTAQGRHLFPTLVGIALFLAIGWWALWPALARPRGSAALGVVLLGLAAFCLPTVVHSVGKPYLPVRTQPWPDAPQQALRLDLGDGLVFDGVRWTATTQGEVRGSLYWRATQDPQQEALVLLELVDGAGNVAAVWAGHPGTARYPTESWSAGDYVRQDLVWPLPRLASGGPLSLRLRIWRDGQAGAAQTLPAPELLSSAQAAYRAAPTLRLYGLQANAVQQRDTVLVTWPVGRLADLGTASAGWEPLLRTTRGDQAAWVVGPEVAPGRYTLRTAGGDTAVTVSVEGRQRSFVAPEGLTPVGALYGGAVELVGYTAQGGQPGSTLHLRLAWRASGRIPVSYTVFTHVVDAEGRVWGQQDKLPGQEYSMLFWAPGEVVVDEYDIAIPAQAPAGLQVEVGLYSAFSGSRAAAVDAQGKPAGDAVKLPL